MRTILNTEGIEDIGNPDFLEEVKLLVQVHKAKAAGYSGQDQPDTWANFREAEAWGMTPLEGCLIRMGDKYRRIQNLRRNPDNDRVGEPIKDTLRDLANYALIAVCLLTEEEDAERTGFLMGTKVDYATRPLDPVGDTSPAGGVRYSEAHLSEDQMAAVDLMRALGLSDSATRIDQALKAAGLQVCYRPTR